MNFKKSVVYQIYIKSFNDSNNDGIGDLNGITEKLDYLQELGIDYIWITPFFKSPQKDNGYDISNYYEIDEIFGTFDDFDKLILESKKRNIGIMLDMVLNHTSTEHEWFQKALKGDEKYRNYYFFRNKITNWKSKFGNSAWEKLENEDMYYLHLFDKTQADLNWENEEVFEELKNIVLFWKNKGVSGFRFDVINLVSKPFVFENSYDDDGRKFYTDGPKIHQYLEKLVKETGINQMITVGEMSSTSLDNCIKYANISGKELSMVFNFHHLKLDYKHGEKWELGKTNFKELHTLFKYWQEGLEKGNAWIANFWCNHDQPRIVSRMGDDSKKSAKMLGAFIHFLRGTPYIYQGEEIGMTNSYFKSINEYVDVESLNYYEILKEKSISENEILDILSKRSRDNSRTPMQWDESINAGFSLKKPWIKVNDNYTLINVKKDLNSDDSLFKFYKKLIELRKREDIISEGNIKFIDYTVDGIVAYKRQHKKDELICIFNFDDKDHNIDINMDKYSVLLTNKTDTNFNCLQKYEFIILKNLI